MMGALQTSLRSMTTATAVELVRATPRRSELTRSVSRAGKSEAFGERFASPAARKEWDLVQQAIAGNADAQEQLFKTYTPRLFRTAFCGTKRTQKMPSRTVGVGLIGICVFFRVDQLSRLG